MHACVRTISVAAAMTLLAAPAALGQHAGDISVGRSAAGQLKTGGFEVSENVIVLPPVSGILNGWSDNVHGLDHVSVAIPEDDLFPLDAGASIKFEIVTTTPAFRYFDDGFNAYDEPGEGWTLPGGPSLHEHPIWHINSDDSMFDPLRTLWPVTYILVDLGTTGYTISEPFTIRYANIACTPGDVNGDGEVDGDDEDPFFVVLADPAAATHEQRCAADVNLDGLVTVDDVGPFLALIGGLAGDLDGDGDVDTADFAVFAQCFGGALNAPAPGCPAGVDADLDADGDVDTADFAILAQNFTGSR